MIGKGRKLILSDKEITPNTIIEVVQKAYNTHCRNVIDINKLIDNYSGIQNVNPNQFASNFYGSGIETTLNYNSSTVRTIVGYTYSQGAQITQRKGCHTKDIEKLTDAMNYENSRTVDNEVGTFCSIAGIGYFGIFPTKEIYSDYMPDYPLVIVSLDPRQTFVVHSNEIGQPSKLSVTYSYSEDTKKTTFYCYTDLEMYIIECDANNSFNSSARIIDHDINPIGLNPIIIVKNSQFMIGDFELAIPVSDAINLLAGDSISDVENVIKSLLVIMNAELGDEEAKKVKENRILQLIGQPGLDVDAKFIYQQLDGMGIQNLREYFEEAYKAITGIPDRKTRGGGGGDTGDAVKLRDGWADIEIVARIKESYFTIAKKKQLAVAIQILKLLGLVDKGFKLEDIDIKLPRNKQDNIQTKAQSFSTLISTNEIAPEDALAIADMTTDITGVIARAKKYKEENQATLEKNDTQVINEDVSETNEV